MSVSLSIINFIVVVIYVCTNFRFLWLLDRRRRQFNVVIFIIKYKTIFVGVSVLAVIIVVIMVVVYLLLILMLILLIGFFNAIVDVAVESTSPPSL